MRRSTIVFGLFLVLIAAIIGYNTFVKQQPPLELVIAVDPTLEDWAKQLADTFNAKNVTVNNGASKIRIKIDASKNDVAVWQGKANWTPQSHPTAWIATSTASLSYLPSNLSFTVVQPTLARTVLVWGGFNSRVNLITDNGATVLDWQSVQAICAKQRWQNAGGDASWGNVNMGINWATSSMAGYGTLMSMAATYQQNASILRNDLTTDAFETWFTPIYDAIQNSERLGEAPASAMASRGATVADFALLTEFEWLRYLSNLTKQEGVTLAYPEYNYVFDFPLAVWNDSIVTDAEKSGIEAFGNFVASAEGQAITVGFGLRPIAGEPQETDALFAVAVPFGIDLEPNYGAFVQTPDRSTADQLLRLLD